MDKYKRVAKEKNTDKQTPEDEIRVTATGRTATYVTYAGKLFNEKSLNKCTIKATGTALATAVTAVEIIKRRFKGLHQITNLGSTEIVDEYEPLEEGLDKVTDVRQVSFIEITLSKIALDTKDKGYQAPISEDLVKEFSPEEMARGRGGRKGRGRSTSRKGKGKGKKGKKSGGSPRKGSNNKGDKGSKSAGRSASRGKGGFKDGGKKGSNKGKSYDKGKSFGKSKGGYDGYGSGYQSFGGFGYDDGYNYGGKSKGKGSKGKSFGGYEGGKSKGKGSKGKGSYMGY